MTGRRNVELWGANDRAIPLGAHEASTEVRLAPEPGVRVAESFNRERSLADAGGAGASEPDRVFLNLENIRGNNGSARFDVYLRPKQSAGGVVADVPVGTFSLFGVEVASSPDGPSGGAGITKVLEVTEALDALQVNRSVPLDALEVRIVPRANVRDEDAITVGQVSFYRQGR